MSLLLKKKGEKFRFYQTIISKWVSGWVTKDEAMNIMENRILKRADEDIEQMRKRFPRGFYDKDTLKEIK